jgi:hypothetical protein
MTKTSAGNPKCTLILEKMMIVQGTLYGFNRRIHTTNGSEIKIKISAYYENMKIQTGFNLKYTKPWQCACYRCARHKYLGPAGLFSSPV